MNPVMLNGGQALPGWQTKTGSAMTAGLQETQCSGSVLRSGKDKSVSEHPASHSSLDFLHQIDFPQCAPMAQVMNPA
jgi:hypothetical protein